MNSIDLSPLYRSSVGFDRLGAMINSALSADTATTTYPPYNIEALEDNRYAITLAVAGFTREELEIQSDRGVLTIKGNKSSKAETRTYLYQGIAKSAFERKFSLADFVEVVDAQLSNGLLTINLVKEIPEAMKPKTIAIAEHSDTVEHHVDKDEQSTQRLAS